MTERMVEANGVELCTEPFGDPTDPAILLIMGVGGSMLWWEDGFCQMLADAGRFVIRFDHRDTGRSVTYEPGQPGYTGADMVADAGGVLDCYGVRAAHLVGVSAGGAFAQVLALDFPDRVLSLVLISTSPVTPGVRGLPSPTAAFGEFVATAHVDWSDSESVIEYLVGYSRMLGGDRRRFDEEGRRALIRRDVERARNIAALQNHDAIPDSEGSHAALSTITCPDTCHPWHVGSDVPAAARRSIGGRDTRGTAAAAGRSRPWRRQGRLGHHRRGDRRAHRPIRSSPQEDTGMTTTDVVAELDARFSEPGCNGDRLAGRPRDARGRRALLDLDGPGRRQSTRDAIACGMARQCHLLLYRRRRAEGRQPAGQPALRPHHRQQRVEVGSRRRDRRKPRRG